MAGRRPNDDTSSLPRREVDAFRAWLQRADPGACLEYHRGLVICDRSPVGSPRGPPPRPLPGGRSGPERGRTWRRSSRPASHRRARLQLPRDQGGPHPAGARRARAPLAFRRASTIAGSTAPARASCHRRVFAGIQHPLRGIARPFRSMDGVGARLPLLDGNLEHDEHHGDSDDFAHRHRRRAAGRGEQQDHAWRSSVRRASARPRCSGPCLASTDALRRPRGRHEVGPGLAGRQHPDPQLARCRRHRLPDRRRRSRRPTRARFFSEGHYQHVAETYPDLVQLIAPKRIIFVDSITELTRQCMAWAKTRPEAFSREDRQARCPRRLRPARPRGDRAAQAPAARAGQDRDLRRRARAHRRRVQPRALAAADGRRQGRARAAGDRRSGDHHEPVRARRRRLAPRARPRARCAASSAAPATPTACPRRTAPAAST